MSTYFKARKAPCTIRLEASTGSFDMRGAGISADRVRNVGQMASELCGNEVDSMIPRAVLDLAWTLVTIISISSTVSLSPGPLEPQES
ncbi:hypothetical protein J6590_054160 [Homalodisca vitripennis]|nr:hypothetical protein J6590_094641 [Homalodisca vitripennis]KAG8325948.1 hypothetical protein J6590_054160 [Homalodisca vitripennis]